MFTIGILTVSDRSAQGLRKDTSGPLIGELIKTRFPDAHVEVAAIVPDERIQIASILREWCDQRRVHLIFTTGGTGLAPRDVTPEATRDVIEREVPGIAEGMRVQSLSITPMAMLSRGIAGTRGRTLIINLPGSSKAVRECLTSILDIFPHAINILTEGPEEH